MPVAQILCLTWPGGSSTVSEIAPANIMAGKASRWSWSAPGSWRPIVLYNVSRPDVSKIAICCLFHRLVIVGRGLNDLDEATAASRSATVQSASQTA